MSHHRASLSYSARRDVLAHVAPRYQEATNAQKTLLLDQIVELTGYERKYAIRLLNHDPKGAARILRPRQPIYGSAVHEALFLAWRTIQYPCAQRLIPFLPKLLPVLERDGHLRLGEEQRRQLLAMSVRTAERLLSTQRRPTPHGLSTTKPGTLLKHQIPIRTFSQWDDHRPGFLEADLVAHCGGNVYGGYLYTLTLTDIATGWTECLPLLNRSPETVLAALKRARTLLPFPLLGLDTDNGGEFINEVLLAYCKQEQLTFTRGRPECSNDNCHIEQKNGAVVRKIVGYDRLVSMLVYQQLGELYQASRLLVNCFQPSMKLQSKHIEGEHERRVYDEAKTPLQRVLLSGVLPQQQLELKESVESLDPLRLVQHVEELQRAVWLCAEGSPGTTLVRFSLSAYVSAAARPSPREALDAPAQEASAPAEVRDWSRSMDDPFLGEWEQIHAYVCARPMASAGEILREWQRRFPEGFVDGHLALLQRRLREMRTHLVMSQTASSVGEKENATASHASPQLPQAVASLTYATAVVFPDPASVSPSLLPTPEGDSHVPGSQTAGPDVPLSKGDDEDQHALPVQEAPAVGHVDTLLPATMTINRAIHLFLQGTHTHDWEPKTREWHETSLGQLQRYLAWRGLILLSSLTGSEIRGWLTFLRTESLMTGAFRVQGTISMYARSAHAFCTWLVLQGCLEQTPFARVTVPRGKKRRLRVIEQETFDRLLQACYAPQTKRATMDYATARNRALLWVLWDTGLLVSEVCALNLEDVDLAQGSLHVQGKGPKGRALPLTPQVQQALTMYLEQYRLRTGTCGAPDPLFLSEQRARLTKNVFTQLFQRLCTRAGLEDRRLTPTMLREMFAIRFLQTGGVPKALQRLLGLAESTPIKRYVDAARSLPPPAFPAQGELHLPKYES
jgi:site-specific recombinase XerD